MFKNYLKLTLRNIWKNKVHSFLNIAGLAVGIACTILIFLWVEDEFNFNHHHKNINNLYQVMTNQSYEGEIGTFSTHSILMAKAAKEGIPEIKNVSRVSWRERKLFSIKDKNIYEEGHYVDSAFLTMFQWPIIEGNAEKAFSNLYSIIITEKMAKKFFGDENPIGKTLKLDNEQEYAITAVLKDIPENSSFHFDWLISFSIFEKNNPSMNNWGAWGFGETFVEMKEHANIENVNKKLTQYILAQDKNRNKYDLFLFPMKDWRLYSEFKNGKQTGGGLITYIRLFSIIAAIILLIACINFMNLSTAKSEERAKEIGVRKVLGANKKLLIQQFIIESVIISFVALILSLAIVHFTLPAFGNLVSKHLTLNFISPAHLIGLIAIALLCGLLAGSYPAFYLSSFNPITVLKGLKIKGDNSTGLIRKILVVLQFSIAIVLIVCTIVIYQQIQYVKNRKTGYDKDNLMYVALQGKMKERFNIIRQNLLSTGTIKEAAMSSNHLLKMYSNADSKNFRWQGKEPGQQVLVTIEYISPHYLNTIGLQLKAGRNFYDNAEQDSTNIIINESFVKLMGMGKENPVNEIISIGGNNNVRIVGVIKDFLYNTLYDKEPSPLIFLCRPEWTSYMVIRFKPNNVANGISKVEQVLKKYNPGYPFEYKFLDEHFNNLFKRETSIGKFSAVFAVLAIFITCLGLFGLAAYTAERRTKEIGIRKVLGASVSNIVTMLSKDFLKLVAIALTIALPIGWWLIHNWTKKFTYRITISWTVFAWVILLVVLITLITVSFQAIKAAMANPVKNLRTE